MHDDDEMKDDEPVLPTDDGEDDDLEGDDKPVLGEEEEEMM